VLTAIFLVIAGLVFYLVYLSLPGSQHFYALLWIGILSLIFAIFCYLAEAISLNPTVQRSLAWAFFGLGFTTLFLTVGLAPSYGVALGIWQPIGFLILAIALGISIALIAYRVRFVRRTAVREQRREEWREGSAPSAFSYAAANSPSVPSTAPPPSPPGGTPPSGGP
jgi:hypothetical protein